jgi:hypothetical protein
MVDEAIDFENTLAQVLAFEPDTFLESFHKQRSFRGPP